MSAQAEALIRGGWMMRLFDMPRLNWQTVRRRVGHLLHMGIFDVAMQASWLSHLALLSRVEDGRCGFRSQRIKSLKATATAQAAG